MATKEHLPLNFREKFIMTQANAKIAKYLGLTDDLTVNKMEITGFDSENNIVEFTESYSRPDKLEVRFVTK
jgi:GntR family transcriptional regulator